MPAFDRLNSCLIFAPSIRPFAENRSWLYRKCMAGGINRDDPDNKIDNKEHFLMAFFKNQVAAVINNKWMKGIIILTFAGYLAGAFYGLTTIKEGLERRKLSKEDSYSVKFFDLEDEYYREFPYRIQVSHDVTYKKYSTSLALQ